MNLENHLQQTNTALTNHQIPLKTKTPDVSDSILAQAREHQLRKAKIAAEEKLRNYATFISSNAHDLRSPFNVIMGYAEMFTQGFHQVNGEDYTHEYATSILSSAQHLLNLIDDLLDVCNIDAEQLQLLETATNIESLIENAAVMVQDRASSDNINFVIAIAPNLPPIFLDQQRICQALTNILSNAVKFTHQNGRIDLTAFKNTHGDLEINISDNGIGMNKKNMARALTEFGKVRNGDNACTGMGLPLAKRLVELHGGVIQLDSELNRGTTVRLTFPAQRWQDHVL